MTALIIGLLAVSLVLNALGIWYTARPAARIEEDGRLALDVPERTWHRSRGAVFLGIGLALNTLAALLGVLP